MKLNRACGIMRHKNRHYAGNFWWAKASHIRTLKKPLRSSNRFVHETWLNIRDNSSYLTDYPRNTTSLSSYWYKDNNLKLHKLAN